MKEWNRVFRVVLIGCGNLGSRHLQALKKTRRKISITVCEPNEEAWNIAIERYKEVEGNECIVNFEMVSNYKTLHAAYDLAIITTNSSGRLEVASWVVMNLGVKYLILEKVVFQALEEFDTFDELLEKKCISVGELCKKDVFVL